MQSQKRIDYIFKGVKIVVNNRRFNLLGLIYIYIYNGHLSTQSIISISPLTINQKFQIVCSRKFYYRILVTNLKLRRYVTAFFLCPSVTFVRFHHQITITLLPVQINALSI